jgi:hypothetical protein
MDLHFHSLLIDYIELFSVVTVQDCMDNNSYYCCISERKIKNEKLWFKYDPVGYNFVEKEFLYDHK